MEETKHNWLEDNIRSILAIIWSLGGIIFMFCAASGAFKGTESIQTQITQGIFGIIMFLSGYYFADTKNKKNPSTNIQTQDNAQVTVGPNVSGPTPDVTVNDESS